MTMRSFGAQALHYFDRPHTGLPPGPIGGPAAWRGSEIADDGDWLVHLDGAAVAELDAARAHAAATGRAPAQLRREDFPLPTLATQLARWRSELRDGRGLVLLRGLPVGAWGEDGSALVFWCLGLHLGTPGAQNPQGELLGHVRDTGEDRRDPMVRLYRTAADIAFHCDLADAVGLLCLSAPSSGGASRLASSVAVHDEMWRTRPELARRLYEPFELDTRNDGGGLPHFPVAPFRWDGSRLRTFFHSDYFRSAPRHADVAPLCDLDLDALDAFEELAGSPQLRLDVQFEPGDVQLISNHTVVHARTAYEDAPGAPPRHLLRLWLSLDAPEGAAA